MNELHTPQSSGKICLNCGHPMTDEPSVCPNCGAAPISEIAPINRMIISLLLATGAGVSGIFGSCNALMGFADFPANMLLRAGAFLLLICLPLVLAVACIWGLWEFYRRS